MIDFKDSPTMTILNMLYKCRDVLLRHNKIAFIKEENMRSVIIEDVLKSASAIIKKELNREVCIDIYDNKSKNKYEKLVNNGYYDLLVYPDVMEESELTDEEKVNSCAFVDNSRIRNELDKGIPNCYRPLWFFTKKDMESYINHIKAGNK